MNTQLFEILPDNFFSILSSEHHKTYADCIFLLFHFLGRGNSFGADKEEIILVLTEYYEKYSLDLDKSVSSREKALSTLRRLKQCGWIFEEDEANYQVLVNFTYYSIPVIKTLVDLKKSSELEYLGYIFLIYSAVKNIDENNIVDLIDQIHHNTNIVMIKLKTLNANIKKYIQDLLNKKTAKDLKSIVENLFIEYKKNIIDDSYHRLKTSDNVSKYRPYITSKLNDLCLDDKIMEKASLELVEKKKFIDVVEAKQSLINKIDMILTNFHTMDQIIAEIDKKNTKYIQMSISKIMFIVNNTMDLQGKIFEIVNQMKTLRERKQINHLFSMFTHKQMSPNSLYTVPKKCLVQEIQIDSEIYLSDIEKRERLLSFIQKDYSKKSINDYVLNQLVEDNKIKASKMPLANEFDFMRLILVYLYSGSLNMNYKIKKLTQTVDLSKYQFTDFEIVRK